VILAYKSSAAAPVFGGVDVFEFVGLAYVGEALVDQLPAAGAVEHVFGTLGDETATAQNDLSGYFLFIKSIKV